MEKRIQMVDLGWQYDQIRSKVEPQIVELLRSGRYIGGDVVSQFARDFGMFHGTDLSVLTCANGSDALYLALRGLGVDGGTVITVPNSFVATAHAIERTGAKARFVDVDAELHTMRPDAIEAAIDDQTVALLPVHLYGHPVDMGPLLEIAERRHLLVVEDCAQACGATWQGERVGTLGDAGCFSFFPTKTLGAAGDGGAVVFRSESAASRAESISRQGFGAVKNDALRLGINSRLDAVQALILSEKLKLLPAWNDARRHLASVYQNELQGVRGLCLPREASWAKHVYHLFVVQVESANKRVKLQAHLKSKGIDTQIHYDRLITSQMPYKGRPQYCRSMPSADQLVHRILSLPLHPGMSASDVLLVCDALKKALT